MADADVEARAHELRQQHVCVSDDEHVVALALVSGARLLYTNDAALIDDFKNREIVRRPGGKIYTTTRDDRVTAAHRRLLADRTLCRAP
ncbi:MAG: hypothetical protein OXU81_00025 [Gammaproteobacteria bacterium]|nr:hypothetical protein [Gammaproteobacteria bacterium]